MHLRRFLFFLIAALMLGPPAVLTSYAQSGPFTLTASQCATITVDRYIATVGIQVQGTWTGTLQPQLSIQGQAPANIQVTPVGSTTPQSTITTNGTFKGSAAGGTTFLLCGNTIASGTAVVYLNASSGSASNSTSGSGSGPALQTNGVPNASQSLLNLSSNNGGILLADAGGGLVNIDLLISPFTAGCLLTSDAFGKTAQCSNAASSGGLISFPNINVTQLRWTGATSGAGIIQSPAVANSPSLLWPINSGTLADSGTGGVSVDVNGVITYTNPGTGAIASSFAGVASVGALTLSGAPFAGTASNSFGQLNINWNTGTLPSTLSTAGEAFTEFAPSGYTGNLVHLFVGTTSQMALNSSGSVTFAGGIASSNSSITAGAGQKFIISGSSILSAGTNGKWLMSNNAVTSFTEQQFGCITSSCVGFGVTPTSIIQNLADGTAGGSFGAGGFTPAATSIGTPTQVYNTAAVSQTASIGATTMLANPAADRNFRFNVYVGQLAQGTTCTVAGSVAVSLVYTDPITGNAYTYIVPLSLSGGTVGGTVPLSISAPAVANVGSGVIQFRAKASTNIQYSATYALGTCSSGSPSFNIYPDLEAL